MLLSLGTEFGGWSLFVKDRKLVYAHNFLKVREFNLKSAADVPAGIKKAPIEYALAAEGLQVSGNRARP